MPFIGEIRIFPYAAGATPGAPAGWMLCDGRSIDIRKTPDLIRLFGVIGRRFGGKGATDFRLPDLRGRLPVQVGAASGAGADGSVIWALAETMGEAAVTLSGQELPGHTHAFQVCGGPYDDGSHGSPVAGDYLRRPLTADRGAVQAFLPSVLPTTSTVLNLAVTTSGGSGTPPVTQPHPNGQPSLTMNFFICWSGEMPIPPPP
ncbi:MAG: tail fiber protein [Alphaproteobacteria bacterium]|nr:tail fiber protein [Alphaproteobacteria bacterium]MBU1525176.1 tail fiber protein [Alphaproteobacteria bacterium]MBU2117470.1 tail fiber protein [Alphaproteobacteria bacterium]MBU2352172.1 tail fiber protein [Alphaproteobacteria bacterium]MBU2381182.1 tail fiber protein [Alphaproteobacteria bacterium]